eukprot:gene3412-6773_t
MDDRVVVLGRPTIMKRESRDLTRKIRIGFAARPYGDGDKALCYRSDTQFSVLCSRGLLPRSSGVSREKQNSLLPHKLVSDAFLITAEIKTPATPQQLARREIRDALMDKIRVDYDSMSMSKHITEFASKGWVFVIDQDQVRLVSGSQPSPKSLEHPAFANNATPIRLEVVKEGLTMLHTKGGRRALEEEGPHSALISDKPSSASHNTSRTIHLYNAGETLPPLPVPTVFVRAWSAVCKSELMRSVRDALLRLVSTHTHTMTNPQSGAAANREIFVTLCRLTSTGTVIGTKINDHKVFKHARLKSANLAQYLRSFQLPGMATRLNDEQVDMLIDTFPSATLSLDEFEYWFTQIGKLDTSEELDPDLIINSLIEENLRLNLDFVRDTRLELRDANYQVPDNITVASSEVEYLVGHDGDDSPKKRTATINPNANKRRSLLTFFTGNLYDNTAGGGGADGHDSESTDWNRTPNRPFSFASSVGWSSSRQKSYRLTGPDNSNNNNNTGHYKTPYHMESKSSLDKGRGEVKDGSQASSDSANKFPHGFGEVEEENGDVDVEGALCTGFIGRIETVIIR